LLAIGYFGGGGGREPFELASATDVGSPCGEGNRNPRLLISGLQLFKRLPLKIVFKRTTYYYMRFLTVYLGKPKVMAGDPTA